MADPNSGTSTAKSSPNNAPSGDAPTHSGAPTNSAAPNIQDLAANAFGALHNIWDAIPDDTPNSHTLFGVGGYHFTVGDLEKVIHIAARIALP